MLTDGATVFFSGRDAHCGFGQTKKAPSRMTVNYGRVCVFYIVFIGLLSFNNIKIFLQEVINNLPVFLVEPVG